ncbi:MAG: hypothetical protein M3N19_10035 [Candidatus Eremiobacteraeota bacterium]|nr:hypothetical protein [Candidatus Eremiobacteraeota bacterium]
MTRNAEFSLMEHVEARRLLGAAAPSSGRVVKFSVLHPVYPSLGCGQLRVLRIREPDASVLEVICGYESYERVDLS